MDDENIHLQVSKRANYKKSIFGGHMKISIHKYLEGLKIPKVFLEDMKVFLEDIF